MGGKDAARLTGFFRTLNTFERHVLLMHYVDELTTPEIAVVLDKTESLVERTLTRLRHQAARSMANLTGRQQVA